MKLALTTAAALFAATSVSAADITNTLSNAGLESGGANLSNEIDDWDALGTDIPGRASHSIHAGAHTADAGFVAGDWFAYYDQNPAGYRWGGTSTETFAANMTYTFSAFGSDTASHVLSIGYLDGNDEFVSLADSAVTDTTQGHWSDLADAVYSTGTSGARIEVFSC